MRHLICTSSTKTIQPSWVLWSLLALVIGLPPLLLSSQASTSYAIGILVASICLIFCSYFNKQKYGLNFSLKLLPWLACALLLHLLIADNFLIIDWERAASSLGILLITVLASGCLVDIVYGATSYQLHSTIKSIFWILLLFAAWASLGGYQPFSNHLDKPIFPFTEPSLFALTLTPFLIFSCITTTLFKRLIYLFIVLGFALYIENLTLIACCVLTFILCIPAIWYSVAAVMIVYLAYEIDLYYYLDRIDFSGHSLNISNLAYIQGWQLIEEALDRSHGWGLGFQQLGVHGTNVSVSYAINKLMRGDLNLLDGSFVLSKIIGELGYFGFLLIFFYFMAFIRAFKFLRQAISNHAGQSAPMLFFSSIIAAYSVELFIRGTGYFSPTGVLLIAAMLATAMRPAQIRIQSSYK